mmetsp:Transcript_8758/g.25074  ORF Transcript_8758/g.25074 Transcript_8758/m.25074 type:complete len:226 (-) Transcript_8758:125-802(-)
MHASHLCCTSDRAQVRGTVHTRTHTNTDRMVERCPRQPLEKGGATTYPRPGIKVRGRPRHPVLGTEASQQPAGPRPRHASCLASTSFHGSWRCHGSVLYHLSTLKSQAGCGKSGGMSGNFLLNNAAAALALLLLAFSSHTSCQKFVHSPSQQLSSSPPGLVASSSPSVTIPASVKVHVQSFSPLGCGDPAGQRPARGSEYQTPSGKDVSTSGNGYASPKRLHPTM